MDSLNDGELAAIFKLGFPLLFLFAKAHPAQGTDYENRHQGDELSTKNGGLCNLDLDIPFMRIDTLRREGTPDCTTCCDIDHDAEGDGGDDAQE